MLFSIMVGLMVLLVAMFAVRQGFFSGLIMFIESVVACLLAFTLYEPAYGLVSDTIKTPAIGEPLVLMVLFLGALAIMRVATDKLIPGNVKMNMYVDWAGGGLCGLFTGLILVGTALIAIQMLPVGSTIVTFDRYEVGSDGQPVRNNLLFKPDNFVAGLLNMMSNGHFGTDEDHRFGRVKPDLVDTLFSIRCSTQTEARHVVPADSVKVLKCWNERKIDHATHEIGGGGVLTRSFATEQPVGALDKFLVCRMQVSQSAANKTDNTIRFRVPQFRIVGTSSGGFGDPEVYLAVGMSDLYINHKHEQGEVSAEQVARLVRFSSQTNFILSPFETKPVQTQVSDGAGFYEFDVAFEVPEDFEPMYLEFKRGARFIFPSIESDKDKDFYLGEQVPDDASSALGAVDVAAAASSGGPRVGAPPGGRVHIANAVSERTGVFTELPVVLDSGESAMSRFLAGNRLRGGDGCHFWVVLPEEDVAVPAQVTEFLVPAGKRMFQVGADQLQAESMYGRALSFAARVAAQIYVQDTDGLQYFAIGQYAAVDIDGRAHFEIQYYPDAGMPERCLQRPKKITASILRSAGRENSKFGYIFLVNPGVTMASFHAGTRGGISQAFTPPIEVPQ